MTNYSWKTGVNGQWGTAADWSGGIPNSVTANATIAAAGAYTVSLISGTAFTVDSVTIANSAVNFSLAGALTLGGTLADFIFDGKDLFLSGTETGGTLDIDSGTLVAKGGTESASSFILGSSASIALSGLALTIGGTSVLDGTIYGNNSAGSSLVVTGNDALSNAGGFTYVENKATLVDAGTITQDYYLYLGNGSATDTSSLVVNTGATYNDAANGYGIYDNGGTGPVSNAGLFEETGGTGYVGAALNNTGTILAAGGSDLLLQDGGAIGGTLAGAGEIDFNNGNFTLSPTLAINVGTLGFDGGTVVLGANLSLAGVTINDQINLSGHNLTLSGGSVLDGTIYGNGSAGNTLVVTGNDTLSNTGEASVENNVTLVDAGTITQDYYVYIGGESATDTSSLVVNAGATYDMAGNAGYYLYNYGTSAVSNAGLFEQTNAAANYVYSAFNNTGTILAVAGSDLQLQDGGTIGGTLAGAGEIDFNGGIFTLSPTLAINVATLGVDGGAVVTLGRNLNLGNSLALGDGTIALNGFNLTLASVTLGGNGEFNGPGTVVVTGAGQNSGFDLVGGAELDIAGSFASTSNNDGFYLTNGVNDTAIVKVESTGTLDLAGTGAGSNFQDYGNAGTLVNAGLLTSQFNGNAGSENEEYVILDSTGTIESDTGLLAFYQGGTVGGLLDGAGEIDFDGGTFTLAPGLALNQGTLGIFSNVTVSANETLGGDLIIGSSGILALNGNNVTLTGTASLQTYGSISGPGTLDITGSATANSFFVVAGAVLEDSGTITQTNNLQLGYFDSGTLSISAGAVYDIQNEGGTQYGIAVNGNAIINNAGLFEVTGFAATGQSSNIGSSVLNTGTMALNNAGTLILQSNLTNDGLVTVANGVIIAQGNVLSDAGKTGMIDIGPAGVFDALGTVAGQTISFTGTGGTLEIGAFANFSGSISGFAAGDVIDLTGTAVNGYIYANNILTLTEATNGGKASLVGTLALGSFAGSIALQGDGASGTEILLNHAGTTYSNPTGAIVTKTWSGANAAWSTGADWSPAGAPGAANIAVINSGTVASNGTVTINQLESGGPTKLLLTAGVFTVDGGGYDYGTLSVSAANFDAATGFAFYNSVILATTGTLEVDSGTLGVDGGAALGGTVIGAGTLDLAAGNVLLNAGLSLGAALVEVTGAAITLSASETIAAPFLLSSGAIDLANHGLTLSGSSVLGSTAEPQIYGIGTVVITGTAQLDYLYDNGDVNLVDAGAITQNAILYLGSGSTDNSSLIIKSGALYDLNDNASVFGIDDYGNAVGSVNNAGLLEMTGYGNDALYISAPIINTGTLLVAEGTLVLDGGGTLGGTLAGAGAIDFNGGTFTLSPGLVGNVATLAFDTGLIKLGGNLDLTQSVEIEIGSSIALNGYSLTLAGASDFEGTVYGNGAAGNSLVITGNDTLTNSSYPYYIYVQNNATLVDAGTITGLIGALYLGDSSSDASGLIIDAGASFTEFSGAGPDIYDQGDGTVSNAGLFEQTGIGSDYITAVFNNTGTILTSLGSELQLDAGGIIGGTLTGGGELDLNNGVFTLAPNAAISVATLSVEALVTLAGAVTDTGFLLLDGGTIALNGQTLNLAGGTINGLINGAGTLDITGLTSIGTSGIVSLGPTGLLELAGTIVNDGQISGGAPNTGSVDLQNGGTVIDQAQGVISGIDYGVFLGSFSGAGGSVDNSGVIEATGTTVVSGTQTFGSAGVVLFSGGTVTNELGGTISGFIAVQLGLPNGDGTTGSGVVTNYGVIEGTGTTIVSNSTFGVLNAVGVDLLNGGTLVNAASGYITAYGSGVYAATGTNGVPGLVDNLGTINATGANSVGALLNAGDSLTNSGQISGGVLGVALLYAGDTVSNQLGGTISGGAVGINGNAAGAVANSGLVLSSGVGISMNAGGFGTASGSGVFESNAAGGIVIASEIGLLETSSSSGITEMVNAGTVIATDVTYMFAGQTESSSGAVIIGNGTIDNVANGVISASQGAIITGSGTLLNDGTITGSLGLAAFLGGAGSRVVIDSTAIFNGSVLDQIGNGALELTGGTGIGTLTGLGTEYQGFSYITIDSGAAWQINPGTLGIAGNTTVSLATGGTLIEQAPASMAGTLALSVGSVIDVVHTVVTGVSLSGTSLLVTLTGGAVVTETLASALTGDRFAITSDGAGGSDLTLFREAASSTISPNPLAFGNHHVGDTAVTRLTLTNTQPADGYSEKLDASFAGATGSISTSGSVSLLAAGSTSTALTVTLGTGAAGSIAGSALVTLATDGTGTDGDAPLSLGTQSIAVTGAVYAYASASLAATTIALGNVHVGAADTKLLSLTDSTANAAYTEALDASFTGTSGAALDAGSIALLGAGTTNATSLSVRLATGTAGAVSGTAILGLTSDGTGLDGLGTTALAAQTITVTGTVYNEATAALTSTVNFGQRHTGASVLQALTLSNSAAAGSYSEALDASFTGTTLSAGSYATSGTVTTLAAGASSTTALLLKLATTTAGTVAGTSVITLSSDGTTIDGLGKTSLGTQTVAVSGAVFNYATATFGATTLSLGQGHVGVADTKMLLIKNSAAPGLYSEGLDAKFSGTSLTAGSFATGGTLTALTAGSTSSALAVGLAGAAGTIAGLATIALTSDGTGIDTLASTALTSQTVAVSGALFNYATASLPATTLALGQHHLGDIIAVTLANSAAAGVYSEGLDAKFSGTTLTKGSFTASGTLTALAAGSSNASSLDLVLNPGTAGSIAGIATIALTSDGAGIDTLASTALAAKTVTITGTAYNYATTSLAGSIVNFGIVHVGQSLSEALTLSNIAATGIYSEGLDAGFTSLTGSFTDSGTIAQLKAGSSNSTSLSLGIADGTAGLFSGTAVLGLTSDGTGIDSLGSTALAGATITLSGTVDNYATAALAQISGAGSLTGSGSNFTLAMGSVQLGAGSLVAGLEVLNSAAGLADLLGGGFTISNASGAFTDTGFGSFSSLGSGQADSAPSITLSGSTAGIFSELITLSSTGSNASGYSGTLANVTLDVTGSVLSSGPVVYTLTSGVDNISGAGNDTIVAQSGQLSAGDVIVAGPGSNILTLAGGGVFDMRAPATLTGVSIVQAQEAVGTNAQTLYLDSGFAGSVNAASGTAGSSLTVYGNTDSATINLGSGNDIIYLGSNLETVNSGAGNDVFYMSASDLGAAINGGAGTNTLVVAGGTSFAMGTKITSISSVVINDTGAQSTSFTASSAANLAITGGNGSDTITLGAAGQSVTTGYGTTIIDATAAQVSGLIVNNGAATLNITTGGNAALNANDSFLTVSLASATSLTLSSQSFIIAIGSSGSDTITAMAAQQTLTGGAGIDTLIGYAGFGDSFLDTTSGLNGDTIKYFGGNDLIDITNLARAGASLAYTGTSTAGTLSVSETGLGVVSSITFSNGSNLAQSLFHMTADGHGGTNIALI